MNQNISVIVVGEMNTDIIISGLPRFPVAGETINGDTLSIAPGGKSRNIAAMAGTLLPEGSVAMVSKTIKDDYNLWETPLTALQAAGVNTDQIEVLENNSRDFPGVSLILVDQNGQNQIIGAPGITRSFAPEDIEKADQLFAIVGKNGGYLAFIGNCPVETALHAMERARQLGIKVLFDPGGSDDLSKYKPVLPGLYLIKPNVHEAKALTGIDVRDFETAKQAAKVFMDNGVENILITSGHQGAYLFTGQTQEHIPVNLKISGSAKDETGCGDQVLAALIAELVLGKNLQVAARLAVIAGTLQFYKPGIQPVTVPELQPYTMLK